MKEWARFATFFISILGLDQVTKALALDALTQGETIPVIPGYFNFTLVFNRGAAFGMFSALPDSTRQLALGAVLIIALVVVLRLLVRDARGDTPSQFALVGVLAGAIGNIIDRFRFDGVVDFLDFYWGNYHWPAFNVADSAICICVGILALRMVTGAHEQRAGAAMSSV